MVKNLKYFMKFHVNRMLVNKKLYFGLKEGIFNFNLENNFNFFAKGKRNSRLALKPVFRVAEFLA